MMKDITVSRTSIIKYQEYLSKKEAIDVINKLTNQSIPFIVLIDFMAKRSLVISKSQFNRAPLRISFPEYSLNHRQKELGTLKLRLIKYPVPFKDYLESFNRIMDRIKKGNSFLANLTFQTPISLNLTLEEIFQYSKSKYKVLFSEKFVAASPEPFIKIRKGKIYTYPMKGTINARIPRAQQILQDDKKENSEHITIVDLLRNDLSRVADKVCVEKYKYFETIETQDKKIIQMSSCISGELSDDYMSKIGDIIYAMLPAGSITGAPKSETINMISEIENHERDFYTGICGYFDGESFDSCVLIRFVEKKGEKYFYRSGGGITYQSNAKKEYQEMIDKIYVPVY